MDGSISERLLISVFLPSAKKGSRKAGEVNQGSEIRITRVPEIIESRRSLLDEIDRFFSRTDEFFEGFVPGFFDIERRRIRAKDLYFEAILSPREVAEGVLFPVTVPVVEPCPRCRRTGLWKGSIGERIFLERSTKCQTWHGDKAFTGGYRFEGCVFECGGAH